MSLPGSLAALCAAYHCRVLPLAIFGRSLYHFRLLLGSATAVGQEMKWKQTSGRLWVEGGTGVQ